MTTFTIATNEYRAGNSERTEYHPCVAWDRLAEITGQFLSKGQLVDIEGRLQTRQWDDDAGKALYKPSASACNGLGLPTSQATHREDSAMEPTSNLNEAVDNPRSRRALLAGVVGGLAAWLVSAAQRAMPAEASAGDPVLAGRSNSGGGFSTELRANTRTPVFKAVNAGGGDALRGVATTGRGVVGIGREGIGVVAQTLNNVGLWAEAHHGGTAINAIASRSATAIVASHRAHSGVAFRTHGKSIFDGQVQAGRLFLAGIANGPPPPGGAKLLVKSNSSGKTQLCVRFNTGVIQVLATEP